MVALGVDARRGPRAPGRRRASLCASRVGVHARTHIDDVDDVRRRSGIAHARPVLSGRPAHHRPRDACAGAGCRAPRHAPRPDITCVGPGASVRAHARSEGAVCAAGLHPTCLRARARGRLSGGAVSRGDDWVSSTTEEHQGEGEGAHCPTIRATLPVRHQRRRLRRRCLPTPPALDPSALHDTPKHDAVSCSPPCERTSTQAPRFGLCPSAASLATRQSNESRSSPGATGALSRTLAIGLQCPSLDAWTPLPEPSNSHQSGGRRRAHRRPSSVATARANSGSDRVPA